MAGCLTTSSEFRPAIPWEVYRQHTCDSFVRIFESDLDSYVARNAQASQASVLSTDIEFVLTYDPVTTDPKGKSFRRLNSLS